MSHIVEILLASILLTSNGIAFPRCPQGEYEITRVIYVDKSDTITYVYFDWWFDTTGTEATRTVFTQEFQINGQAFEKFSTVYDKEFLGGTISERHIFGFWNEELDDQDGIRLKLLVERFMDGSIPNPPVECTSPQLIVDNIPAITIDLYHAIYLPEIKK